MEKLKLILAGLLTTVYKMSDEQVAALVEKADGEDFDVQAELGTLLDADKSRINSLKTDSFNDGHKKGKSESLKDLEKQVRAEFDISDESIKGLDLIKEVHAKDREAGKKGLTDDDVKKHQAYIALQKKLDDAQKEVETKVTTAVQEAETKFNRERVLQSAKSKALEVFEGLNPVLPSDPQRAAKQKEMFLREIEAYEFDTAEDKSLIVKKDGKALADDHGNLVDFDSLVKNTASSLFDFKQSKDRGSEGNKTTASGTVRVPKTEDEYTKIVMDSSIPTAERQAIKEAWNAKQA